MKPVQQTGDSTGGPTTKIQKPLDAPKNHFGGSTDSTPKDTFHEEPLDEGLMTNRGDMSKKFS